MSTAGHVIRNRIGIRSDTDLDDTITPGVYAVRLPLNGPSGVGDLFIVEVTQAFEISPSVNRFVVQKAFDLDNDGVSYVRIFDSAAWSAWAASGGGGGGGANLTFTRNATTVTILSDTGTDATIPAADTDDAGVMTADMFDKLAGIEAGAQVNIDTDLAIGTHDDVSLEVESSTGDDIVLPAATPTSGTNKAGLMTAADKEKLDGIEAGAEANIDTDLAIGTHDDVSLEVESSTGNDIVLPAATLVAGTNKAGLLTSAEKTKLAGIAAGATAYTDEMAQDAVGGALDNGTVGDINFSYDDVTPKFSGVVKNASITYAKFQDVLALSVVGRAANSDGVAAAITASADHLVLRRSGASISFGEVVAGGIASNAITTAKLLDENVTFAKIQNVSATTRFLGRFSASAGIIEEITGAQARAMLDVRSKNAAVVTYFIRDDATGDTNRDGTINNAANAFLTINGLAAYLAKSVDLGRFKPSISVGPGVFAPCTFSHPWVGQTYCDIAGDTARTITNVVNNGSGLCRLTVSTAAVGSHRALVTGDKVIVREVLGATGANTAPNAGPVTITVINSTTVDIQGSTFGGTYTSGGAMVCTGIQASADNQTGINLQDLCVLAPDQFWFDSAGFNNFTAIGSGQYSILDPGANTYHRANVHLLISPVSSVNESAKPFITGNAAAHLQCFQGSRVSLFTQRYVAGGVSITVVYGSYYNAVLTASAAIVHSGPGAAGGSSPLTGTKYIMYRGGQFTDSIIDATWPGTVAGINYNLQGPGTATTANSFVKFADTTGNNLTELSDTDATARLNVATTSLKGLMSSADKVILDTLNGAQVSGLRNRLVNGNFIITNVGEGAATTVNGTNSFYAEDMWFGAGVATAGVFTMQRIADPDYPGQFGMRMAVTTNDTSIASTERYIFGTRLEGFSVADFGCGTSLAKQVTVSFDVRCSMTGTFGFNFTDATNARSYVATFTVNAANTRESKTVTAVMDTTAGSWVTGNGVGLALGWCLAAGTNFQTTAGSWVNGNLRTTSAQTNFMGTTSATFDIFNVQLELGPGATKFEQRHRTIEELMCQRYHPCWISINGWFAVGMASGTTTGGVSLPFLVPPRTISGMGATVSAGSHFSALDATSNLRAFTGFAFNTATQVNIQLNGTGATGLVAGNAMPVYGNTASARIRATGPSL